jgi:hypothetical protein
MLDTSILVLANKQDQPGALDPTAVCEAFDLTTYKHRKWHVQVKTSEAWVEKEGEGAAPVLALSFMPIRRPPLPPVGRACSRLWTGFRSTCPRGNRGAGALGSRREGEAASPFKRRDSGQSDVN